MRHIAIVLLLTIAACSRPQDLHVPSPTGRAEASVRNHWTIDPPAQSLWLDETRLVTLGEDVDWCNTIVWSGGGSTVAYLVQDAKLIAAGSASRRIVSTQWLVERDGYLPSQRICELQLTADRRAARFKRCPRAGGACSEPVEARIR